MEIPLELIDEPAIPIRETMDEVELAEGALSVMRIGLINPLTVIARGERFEVVAGHRRLLECRIANYSPVPCRVMVGDNIDPLAILIDENARREEVNPVHEARFYSRVLAERANNDVDQLCAIVQRRREHVEGRLLLLLGHPRVCEAVEQRKIRLAVANELNKIPDEGRLMLLLDVAIQSGATAKMVAEWRAQGAELGPVHILPESELGPELPPASTSTSNPMTCVLCEGTDYPHLMQMLWVHFPCMKILMRMLQREQPAGATNEG